MALYCMGVMCSKPGGGTSQYLRTFFFFSWRGERLGEAGGESGAGRPQSDQRWACDPPGSPQPRLGSQGERGRDQGRPVPGRGLFPVLGQTDEDRARCAGEAGEGVEGRGRREAHINPPCSSLAPLVKGLLGVGGKGVGRGDWGPSSPPHAAPPRGH